MYSKVENKDKAAKAKALASCQSHTKRSLQVCDLLEALADDLPRRQAPVWREAAYQCQVVLQPHFRFLTRNLLPKLKEKSQADPNLQSLLTRYATDCSNQLHSLSDLDDLLNEALSIDRFDDQPDALGYALRGFFEALRLKLSWEQDVLWPLAARLLSDNDFADTGHLELGLMPQ